MNRSIESHHAPTGLPSEFWEATLDALPDSVAVLDEAGAIVAVNRSWRDFAAANGGEGIGVGDDYLAVCEADGADETAAEAAAALREVLAGERDGWEGVYPCHAPDRERWFLAQIRPFHGEASRRAVVVHHDITARHTAQRRAHEQAELLAAVDAAVIAISLDGTVLHWNAGAEALYGWMAEEIVGERWRSLLIAPAIHRLADGVRTAVLAHGHWEGQFEALDRSGREFPVYMRSRLLRDADGAPRAIICVGVDMTQRVAMERELRSARDFLETVTQTVPDGLCVLDLEGRVTLANRAAEELLGWGPGELAGEVLPLARRRVAEVRETGATVRVEDAVLLREDGAPLPVSYSLAPFATERGEQALVVVFGDISERKEREQRLREELEALSWVGRINDALQRGRFVLYAQPIVDLGTGATVQHELLLRMLGEDGEPIAPGRFLPVAEQHGQIGAIDRWVFEQALGHAGDGHRVELNVSAHSLSDATFLDFVKAALAEREVDPALIGFEITETALIGNETVALSFVEEIRRLGCAVALDDFGTGYGSFRYLKHLPVNVLKIDREFVLDLDGPDAGTSRHVIEAIVSLARGMGQRTVAEGVETETARAALQELGVDLMQGYLLGQPAPARELLRSPSLAS